MATLINSNKTNFVFVNNGVTFNSIAPTPPLFDILTHNCGPRASPYGMCGPSVGWKMAKPDI